MNLQINTSVTQLLNKDQQSDIVKKALTMALIAQSFPEESWIHIYTDGSASNAVTDGRAGIYVKFPDQPTEAVCLATGKFCSNYKAEVAALSKLRQLKLSASHRVTAGRLCFSQTPCRSWKHCLVTSWTN